MQQASTAHTPNERAELEERRNLLRRHLNAWMEARNLYLPLTSEGHAKTSPPESPHGTSANRLPESMPLGLPSTLPPSLRQSCPFSLAQIELCFRLAQAEDSLAELRRLLRLKMGLRDYKLKQIGPSQRVATRARNLIGRFEDKVSRCKERYRVARVSLLTLDPTGEWQTRMLELEDKDIRAPGRGDVESEGFRKVPWIWLATRPGPLTDEELDSCEYTSYLNIISFHSVDLHLYRSPVRVGEIQGPSRPMERGSPTC